MSADLLSLEGLVKVVETTREYFFTNGSKNTTTPTKASPSKTATGPAKPKGTITKINNGPKAPKATTAKPTRQKPERYKKTGNVRRWAWWISKEIMVMHSAKQDVKVIWQFVEDSLLRCAKLYGEEKAGKVEAQVRSEEPFIKVFGPDQNGEDAVGFSYTEGVTPAPDAEEAVASEEAVAAENKVARKARRKATK